MTERRETGRLRRKPASARGKPGDKPNYKSGPRGKSSAPRGPAEETDWSEGERIAKYLARAGVASRREVERLIEQCQGEAPNCAQPFGDRNELRRRDVAQFRVIPASQRFE